MASRLILLEGVPCTGKTSTARFVSSQVRGWHPDVRLYTEEALWHPADLVNYSFLTPEQYREFPEDDRVLLPVEPTENPEGYLVYTADLYDELREKLETFKLYGCQPWEVERPLMLERWRQFVRKAMDEDAIYIFDGVFFERPICEMMMWFDLKRDEIESFMKELAEIMRPLEPFIIYLESDQIEARVRKVSAERDYEWLEDFIAYHTGQGYGEQDMEGCIAALEARQGLELGLLQKLSIAHLIIQNPFEDWVESNNIIRLRLREYLGGKVTVG